MRLRYNHVCGLDWRRGLWRRDEWEIECGEKLSKKCLYFLLPLPTWDLVGQPLLFLKTRLF